MGKCSLQRKYSRRTFFGGIWWKHKSVVCRTNGKTSYIELSYKAHLFNCVLESDACSSFTRPLCDTMGPFSDKKNLFQRGLTKMGFLVLRLAWMNSTPADAMESLKSSTQECNGYAASFAVMQIGCQSLLSSTKAESSGSCHRHTTEQWGNGTQKDSLA